MVQSCLKSGICCKLFLINLTEEEYKSGKYKTQFEKFVTFKNFKKAELCGANIIEQKKDGSCYYLKGTECSIHDSRPVACRKFFCNSKNKKFKTMIGEIKEYKKNQISTNIPQDLL